VTKNLPPPKKKFYRGLGESLSYAADRPYATKMTLSDLRGDDLVLIELWSEDGVIIGEYIARSLRPKGMRERSRKVVQLSTLLERL
jgi:hypothetical protein